MEALHIGIVAIYGYIYTHTFLKHFTQVRLVDLPAPLNILSFFMRDDSILSGSEGLYFLVSCHWGGRAAAIQGVEQKLVETMSFPRFAHRSVIVSCCYFSRRVGFSGEAGPHGFFLRDPSIFIACPLVPLSFLPCSTKLIPRTNLKWTPQDFGKSSNNIALGFLFCIATLPCRTLVVEEGLRLYRTVLCKGSFTAQFV